MKVRVIKDPSFDHIYNVEIKRWFFPFWVEVRWACSLERAIEKARYYADPNINIVWKNYDL
jgi:hypothetical protein